MACTRQLICKMLPFLVIVTWFSVFIVMGTVVMSEEQGLREEICGQNSHIRKYIWLNLVFAFFSMVTYFVFPGGGEGARARAVLCCIVHMAFCSWGTMMWSYMSDACQHILSEQYSYIIRFLNICIVHNAILSILIFTHEVFLGDHLGYDLTLVPEIRKDSQVFSPPHDAMQSYVQPIVSNPVTAPQELSTTTTRADTPIHHKNIQEGKELVPPELNLNSA